VGRICDKWARFPRERPFEEGNRGDGNQWKWAGSVAKYSGKKRGGEGGGGGMEVEAYSHRGTSRRGKRRGVYRE